MTDTSLNMQPEDTCCADLYQSPLVRYLLGESLHPGGLALTRALGKELGLTKGQYLLDVACGRGASAIMLAQTYKCRVAGIDTDARALEGATKDARRYRLDSLVAFVEGDATHLPFPPAAFDAVLCECATSLFSNRQAALCEIARVLKPSGRLALSDVTFRPETLPLPLDSSIARALCIPLGTGPEQYVHLIQGAGLTIEGKADYSNTVEKLLDKAESLLGIGRRTALATKANDQQLDQIAVALNCASELARQGDLGYWTFVAGKP